MGNFDQKILIAFKCYDVDDDQCLDQKEVITVLKNVPIHVEGRYGSSFAMSGDN
jgi:Ca2+-binding EF-hand superfamily protein